MEDGEGENQLQSEDQQQQCGLQFLLTNLYLLSFSGNDKNQNPGESVPKWGKRALRRKWIQAAYGWRVEDVVNYSDSLFRTKALISPLAAQQCWLTIPQSWVSLWELPSVKESQLIQVPAPSLGQPTCNASSLQGYKGPAPASIWSNSEWPFQLQSSLWNHPRPLLKQHHRSSAFPPAYPCLPASFHALSWVRKHASVNFLLRNLSQRLIPGTQPKTL